MILKAVGAAAQMAEATGFFSGISPKKTGKIRFLPLAVAAAHTEDLELRTSIAIAFARWPWWPRICLGIAARMSNGNFTLGLGDQVKGHNVRRFSVPWSAPAPRMREYVQSIRAIWDCWKNGTPLDYQGEHYQFSLMTPNFTPEPAQWRIAKNSDRSRGPGNDESRGGRMRRRYVARLLHAQILRQVILPKLQQGLNAKDKARSDFEISGGGFIVTGKDDEAVDKMFEWVRMRVGFYGSTPSYWPVFEAHGWQDLGQKLNDMSKKGQWQDMTKEISDDVVREFVRWVGLMK